MHRLACLTLPLTVLLPLAACNANGNRAHNDFNAAGTNLGNGKIASGATDIGRGFSDGANATGDAITSTAHKIGEAFQQ